MVQCKHINTAVDEFKSETVPMLTMTNKNLEKN